MADLWVHDYNDTFGVHYGINTSNYIDPATGKSYVDDHGTAKLPEKILNILPNKDNINPYLYPYPGVINRGETFTEAKTRYNKSPFMKQGEDSDHQHPIIAVFDGKDYIWPTRNTKDVNGNVLYVFKDYASNEKKEITNNDYRIKNISKAGGSFMLYIDTYNTNKLYKCNYSFNILSPFDKWIYVENGIPAKESQNIINNKDITIINREYNANVGSIWWDYSINETNNTLIGVDMHEENATEVDSTLNVIIKPNFSPFSKTATLMLYDQFDQFKGMLVGETNGNGSDIIIYTINQEADDINFDKIEFYANDNTSAQIITDSYGPMYSSGGDGWIYFKITGTSSQGAIRTFGEYPDQPYISNQTSNLKYSCNINGCTLYTPTYNPGTGIWTMKVKFSSNKPDSTITYDGEIDATVDKNTVSYNGKETAQITPSGIVAHNQPATDNRTFIFTISEEEKLNANPPYKGNVTGSINYEQNGYVPLKPKEPTYGYEIMDDSIKWASVSQSGLVSFEQNNTGSQRTVNVKVYCNEQPNFFKTITITQSATIPNFSNEYAYIIFYTDNTASTETKVYGPVEGSETSKSIYFKVYGKNDNDVYFELTDTSKITSITSETCNIGTLTFDGSKNIFTCNIQIPANNGEDNTIDGELTITCSDAGYKDESLGLITINGLTINNSNPNIIPKNKDHIITVKVENKDIKGNSCTYKQNAGKISENYIKELEYELVLSGNKVTGSNAWVYGNDTNNIYVENGNNYVKWKENTTNSMRGGNNDHILLTCNCYKILNKKDENNKNVKEHLTESTVSPRQKYNLLLNIPKDYILQSVNWNTLYIFDSNDYTKTTEAIKITPTSTNCKYITGISANGGIATIYFKIYGVATYSDGTNTSTINLFYGSSTDMANPSSNITCNIVDKTNNKVSISKNEINGVENFAVDINVGPTVNTSTSKIADIYFDLAADNSGNNYWGETTFNESHKVVEISQNGYTSSAEGTVVTYSGEVSHIEFSIDNITWDRYVSNEVVYEKTGSEIIEKLYFRISLNIYKNENGNTVSTKNKFYTDNVTVTSDDPNNIKPTTTYSNNVYTLSSFGMSSNSNYEHTFSVETNDITYDYNKIANVSIKQKTFENCLKLIKTNIVSTQKWTNITFYSSEDCNTALTKLDVDSNVNNYTIYFKITNSTDKTTYTGDVSNIILTLTETGSDSPLTISCSSTGTSGVYSITRSINNVSSYQKVYTISDCRCETYLLTGSIEIWKKETGKTECILKFYSPLKTETSYYDSWVNENIFNEETEEITSTSITSKIGNFTDTTTKSIYLKSTGIPKVLNGQTEVTVTNVNGNLYKFDISSNNSINSNVIYNISTNCSTDKTLKLVLPAKSVTVTYKIVWNNVLWGDNLTESSDSSDNTVEKSGCYKDEDFSYRFRISGTRTTYENGTLKDNSSVTVYLNDIDYINSSFYDSDNSVNLLNYTIKQVSGTKSVFYIEGSDEGKVPNNISNSNDTNSRYCSVTLSIKEKTSGDITWDSNTTLNNKTFTLTQNGNVWDPYFTY